MAGKLWILIPLFSPFWQLMIPHHHDFCWKWVSIDRIRMILILTRIIQLSLPIRPILISRRIRSLHLQAGYPVWWDSKQSSSPWTPGWNPARFGYSWSWGIRSNKKSQSAHNRLINLSNWITHKGLASLRGSKLLFSCLMQRRKVMHSKSKMLFSNTLSVRVDADSLTCHHDAASDARLDYCVSYVLGVVVFWGGFGWFV